MLRKDVYPYEYMDQWEKINEKSLSKKEEFYGNITMKDTIDADYIYARRVCKNFQIKNLAKCQNLYLKSDTLLLADVFQNVRKIFWKIHHLDPANFFQLQVYLDKQLKSN